MTVDADDAAATPARGARRGRSPFELLRFTATPVPGALVVVEIEGRVAAASERFARRPVLVVEGDRASGADRPRLELAPSRTALDGDRWRATYAIPAESYDAARFALGLRGTLLDLPNPDEPADAERLTLLAREANALRRQLEDAEAEAATARTDATSAAGELGAAVSAARDEALAESAERVSDLEREVVETHRLAGSDAAEARTAHETALAGLQAEHDRATNEAAERHAAALAEAEARADAAQAAADERVRVAEAATEAAEQRAATTSDETAERRRAADAQARALAAEEGIAVLRAELAEERERAQALEEKLATTSNRLDALRHAAEADDPDKAAAARVADLEQQLAAANGRVEALRRAAAAEQGSGAPDRGGLWAAHDPGEDETRVVTPTAGEDDDPTRALTPVRSEGESGEDDTRPLAAVPAGEAEDDTQPFTTRDERAAAGEPLLPLERGALPRQDARRSPGAYVAVGALALFVVVLLGLLLGFLS